MVAFDRLAAKFFSNWLDVFDAKDPVNPQPFSLTFLSIALSHGDCSVVGCSSWKTYSMY